LAAFEEEFVADMTVEAGNIAVAGPGIEAAVADMVEVAAAADFAVELRLAAAVARPRTEVRHA
jgi:hypothetical protein